MRKGNVQLRKFRWYLSLIFLHLIEVSFPQGEKGKERESNLKCLQGEETSGKTSAFFLDADNKRQSNPNKSNKKKSVREQLLDLSPNPLRDLQDCNQASLKRSQLLSKCF